MTPAMIIPMIAGPQGTQTEDYAVHLSPQAKLPWDDLCPLVLTVFVPKYKYIHIEIQLESCCPSVHKYKYNGYKYQF